MSYVFKKIKDPANSYDVVEWEMKIERDDLTLPEMMEHLRAFLVAAGYVIDSSEHIELVGEESGAFWPDS